MPLPERQFIDRFRRSVRGKNPEVTLGIGDDCAILRVPAGHETLVTTDFSLEGVHFRREWQSPECIGHRCLARGLSDIAAMGGRPIAAFLSLALPPRLPQSWADRFLAGLHNLAHTHKVELAGGDTSQSPSRVLADIMVLGSVRRGTALLRSGAKAGDLIYVTGELGESAAVLQLLSAGVVKKRDVLPEPRVAVGQWLARKRVASAAIDISDGLSTDLSHICDESDIGAAIHAEAIPIHPTARRVPERRAHRRGDHALNLVLHGGEDYELLFTAPKSKRVPAQIAGVKITRIGEMVRGTKLRLIRNGKPEPLVPQGWEQFR
jgi:thiamine-monophosphate kinase